MNTDHSIVVILRCKNSPYLLVYLVIYFYLSLSLGLYLKITMLYVNKYTFFDGTDM